MPKFKKNKSKFRMKSPFRTEEEEEKKKTGGSTYEVEDITSKLTDKQKQDIKDRFLKLKNPPKVNQWPKSGVPGQ